MEIILPLLNLRDKIKKISLENSWTSNVGCIIETRGGELLPDLLTEI